MVFNLLTTPGVCSGVQNNRVYTINCAEEIGLSKANVESCKLVIFSVCNFHLPEYTRGGDCDPPEVIGIEVGLALWGRGGLPGAPGDTRLHGAKVRQGCLRAKVQCSKLNVKTGDVGSARHFHRRRGDLEWRGKLLLRGDSLTGNSIFIIHNPLHLRESSGSAQIC